jgi:hypothetical protein
LDTDISSKIGTAKWRHRDQESVSAARCRGSLSSLLRFSGVETFQIGAFNAASSIA